MTIEELLEIEEIRTVKYRYVRGVDTRDWDLVASTLTKDCTSAYAGGKLSYQGRDEIVEFLRTSLPAGEALSSHQVHHPEIELTSATTATARWALSDVVLYIPGSIEIRGAAFYEDEMTKVDGEWKISHVGYRRLYEDMRPYDASKITDHWWARKPE